MASLTLTRTNTLRTSSLLQTSRASQTRYLSRYRPLNAEAAAAANPRNMPQQPSTATRMKNLKRSEMPSDLGLIPQLYIRPCGELPKFFSEPRLRLRLEWFYIRYSLQSLASMFQQLRWSVAKDPLTGKRKTIPLQLRERYAVAQELHTKLYKAIANGDKGSISKIACSGLENQQHGRIDRRRIDRKPDESWSVKYRGWVLPEKLLYTFQSLVPSYFKSIHVVSDRIVPVPVSSGVMLRQVVVRVDSRQDRNRNDGSALVTKDLREYVVLQKMVFDGVPQDWKIWGTVSPSSTKDALELIESNKAHTRDVGSDLMDKMSNVNM